MIDKPTAQLIVRESRIAPVFATVTAASGCVIEMAQPSLGASKVTIPSETIWSGSTLTLRSQMVKAFEASHAGITVMATNIPSATGDAKLQSQITARDPPDVFSEWSPVHGEYAANGLIQPKNPTARRRMRASRSGSTRLHAKAAFIRETSTRFQCR